MIGRKDMKKETMAKRARTKVMGSRMSEKMVSPRKKMDMGMSPGKGMGADSAPMAFKKGGAVKKYAMGGMASDAATAARYKSQTGASTSTSNFSRSPDSAANASAGKALSSFMRDRAPQQANPNDAMMARAQQAQRQAPRTPPTRTVRPTQNQAASNDAMARYKSQTGASTSTSNFSRSPDSAANASAGKALSSFMRDRAPQQANPNDAMMARAQQAQMQQAGTPPMGMKKGGAVKAPVKKGMKKGMKDGGMAMKKGMKGKEGMMLIIGLGKKGKK